MLSAPTFEDSTVGLIAHVLPLKSAVDRLTILLYV